MKRFLIAAALAAAAPGAWAAAADILPQVQATEVNLLRALVDQGVLTADKAREMLRKAGLDPDLLRAPDVVAPRFPQLAPIPPAAGASATLPPGTPLLPEATRSQIIDEVQQDVRAQSLAEGRANPASLPFWVSRLKVGGDLRLRYLRNDFASDNSPAQAIDGWYQLANRTTLDSLDNHEHLQLRARLNFDARISDGLSAGMRVVTAGGNDASASPVDYDVELGRYGRPFSAAISLAYLQWAPGPVFRLTGGRMNNPYFRSDLVFAPDLSLDGVAVDVAVQPDTGWGAYLHGGAHPLQTSQNGPFNAAADQWLLAAQSGVQWRGVDESHLQLALAYYDFSGLQGKPDPVNPANNSLYDASAPLFRQMGNTMFDIHYQVLDSAGAALPKLYGYAAQFRLMNVGAEYEFARFDPLRLAIQLDWVRNIGFDAAQIRQRIGNALCALPAPQGPPYDAQCPTSGPGGGPAGVNGVDRARTNGYLVNLRVGAAQLLHRWDWQAFAGVRYLERDAVPDAFTSPDYRLGGTDNQASYIGLNLGLSGATSISMRHVAARSIDSGPKFSVDTWFLDLNGRF